MVPCERVCAAAMGYWGNGTPLPVDICDDIRTFASSGRDFPQAFLLFVRMLLHASGHGLPVGPSVVEAMKRRSLPRVVRVARQVVGRTIVVSRISDGFPVVRCIETGERISDRIVAGYSARIKGARAGQRIRFEAYIHDDNGRPVLAADRIMTEVWRATVAWVCFGDDPTPDGKRTMAW